MENIQPVPGQKSRLVSAPFIQVSPAILNSWFTLNSRLQPQHLCTSENSAASAKATSPPLFQSSLRPGSDCTLSSEPPFRSPYGDESLAVPLPLTAPHFMSRAASASLLDSGQEALPTRYTHPLASWCLTTQGLLHSLALSPFVSPAGF